jgi:hypothetical protein
MDDGVKAIGGEAWVVRHVVTETVSLFLVGRRMVRVLEHTLAHVLILKLFCDEICPCVRESVRVRKEIGHLCIHHQSAAAF